MTKATTWGVRAAVLLTIAWPLVGEAGTVDLPGTSWSLSGKARVSGVLRQGGRSRPFRDSTSTQMTASFPSATGFSAHDFKGWDYTGSYEQRGRSGATVKLTFNASSEAEFDVMLSAWLSALSGDAVTADGRSTPLTAVVRHGKATLRSTRRFSATAGANSARGTWSMRVSGSQI
jgi:hypothetical protein